MATLKELVNEVTTIKNELKTCHTNLKNNLVSKGITVSSTDKMSSLIGKVANIEKEVHNLPKYYSVSGSLLSCFNCEVNGYADRINNKLRVMYDNRIAYIDLDTGVTTQETQTLVIQSGATRVSDYEYATHDSTNKKILIHNLNTQKSTSYNVGITLAYPSINVWRTCSSKKAIYIMGVYGDSNYNWNRSSNIYMFDLSSKTTTLMSTKLLLPRRSCASFINNDNEIYVLGGCLEGSTSTRQTKIEMYDVKLNTITDKGDGATALGEHITNPAKNAVFYLDPNGRLYKYDFLTNTNTKLNVEVLYNNYLYNDDGKVYMFKSKCVYID